MVPVAQPLRYRVRTLVWAVSPALPAGSARGRNKLILSKSTKYGCIYVNQGYRIIQRANSRMIRNADSRRRNARNGRKYAFGTRSF